MILFSQQRDSNIIEKQIDSLIEISEKYAKTGNYKDALPLAKSSLELIRSSTGIDVPKYSYVLIIIAKCQHAMGENGLAQENFILAKESRLKLFGNLHPLYGVSLFNLGNFYRGTQRAKEALKCHLEAKSIFEQTVGTKSNEFLNLLNSLANDYVPLGQLEEAIITAKAALDLLYEKKDTTSKLFGTIAINIARQLRNAGHFEESEFYYLKAKQVLEQNPGKESIEYVNLLGSLAILYRITGRFTQAEEIFLEAISIQVTTKERTGDLHSSYESLAILYQKMNRLQDAEKMIHKTLDIREAKMGKESFLYLQAQLNLASIYYDKGQFEVASSIGLKILQSINKHAPNYPLELGQIVNMLAGIFLASENYFKADSLYRVAKKLNENLVGKSHSQYLESITGIATLYTQLNKMDSAKPYILEMVELRQQLIERARSYLSEIEFSAYEELYADKIDQLFNCAQVNFDSGSWLNPLCYNAILYYKSLQLNTISELRRKVKLDSNLVPLYNLYVSTYRQLISELTKPNNKRLFQDSLQNKVNLIERQLIQNVKSFEEYKKLVTWQEIQEKLKPGEAAIEFILYKGGKTKLKQEAHYAALLVRKEDQFPVFIPLCDERAMKQLMGNSGLRRMEYVNNLYQTDTKLKHVRSGKTIQNLYGLIWKPLEPYLNSIKLIYYSPAGLLNRINLNALVDTKNRLISGRFDLVHLISTRQVIDRTASIPTKQLNAVVIGNLNYNIDEDSSIVYTVPKKSPKNELFRAGLLQSDVDTTISKTYWQDLAGSKKECHEITDLLNRNEIPYSYLERNFGTEESFKNLGNGIESSPGLIHVSTHGFFFSDSKDSFNIGNQTSFGLGELIYKYNEHPMIRSGLLMAGSNYAWKHGNSFSPGREDGILTAYEISQLDLHHTELVVLSACETGLGDIHTSEGVYGLQRAFKIAGTKYIIMSLWQIPDLQTSELMQIFYSNWLLKDLPIRKSLQLAQQEMINKKYEPFYWAGFVLVE